MIVDRNLNPVVATITIASTIAAIFNSLAFFFACLSFFKSYNIWLEFLFAKFGSIEGIDFLPFFFACKNPKYKSLVDGHSINWISVTYFFFCIL